ncbi:MAG: ATP-grasp domain-containing protein [Saezia sp.]
MWIHEYQAKDLLRQYTIPVLSGIAVFSVQEAVEAAQKLGGEAWYVKAQTHCEKRVKEGVLVRSFDELQKQVSCLLNEPLTMLEAEVYEKKIRRLLIEECVEIEEKYSFSIAINCSHRKLAVSLSRSGGGAKNHAEIEISPLGVTMQGMQELVANSDVPNRLVDDVMTICQKLYTIYRGKDAIFFDVKLGWVKQRARVEVIDARICFDDNALFRQLDISVLRDLDEQSPSELEASLYNILYVDLKGSIGCLSNGGGLSVALLDMLQHLGGQPANVVNIEGLVTEEKMLASFEIMQKNKAMRVILINIVAEVFSCDLIAKNIVNAFKLANLSIPMVVRLKGQNEDEAGNVLKSSGLSINVADSMFEAIEKAVVLGA